jgi:uracil-DNA glycosylase
MKTYLNLFALLPETWKKYIKEDFFSTNTPQLEPFLSNEYSEYMIFPAISSIFYAFEWCAPHQIKVVILGQDPYHGLGQAHGLSFSVPTGTALPPSLKNIFLELKNDLAIENKTGNLESWAKQGVFLLNSVLTVRANSPGSHANKGWEIFTDEVIKLLNNNFEGLIFVLWGNYAIAKKSLINTQKHLVITSAHPSPFSATRGFFGSKPFSKINNYLITIGKTPINWKID